MVLYQEPSGGAVPDVYRGEAKEEEKLDVGSFPSIEKASDHRAEASEAHAEWPQWVAGLPHLLPLLSCPIGGKEAANVGILWPDGS